LLKGGIYLNPKLIKREISRAITLLRINRVTIKKM